MAAIGHFLTPTIMQIELYFNDLKIGQATGFFLKYLGNKYLVSAWHVFAGCDPLTGQPRGKDGAVPNNITFQWVDLTEVGLVLKKARLQIGEAVSGTALWFGHPKYGQTVDVGVLPLGFEFDWGKTKDLLDPAGHDENMFIDIGCEVFLPGFPLGISDGLGLAVWKRASVATSLEWGDGVSKKFLVDTASREGMSGAPCLAINNWRYYRIDRSTGKMSVVDRPLSQKLLGVYSGRILAKDDFGAQLGVVWRENLIFETIQSSVQATVKLIQK